MPAQRRMGIRSSRTQPNSFFADNRITARRKTVVKRSGLRPLLSARTIDPRVLLYAQTFRKKRRRKRRGRGNRSLNTIIQLRSIINEDMMIVYLLFLLRFYGAVCSLVFFFRVQILPSWKYQRMQISLFKRLRIEPVRKNVCERSREILARKTCIFMK